MNRTNPEVEIIWNVRTVKEFVISLEEFDKDEYDFNNMIKNRDKIRQAFEAVLLTKKTAK